LSALIEALEDRAAPMAHPRPPRILIAEDYGLIGMMLEQDLREAAYEVAGPFASCAAALKWLATQTPDAAILDIELEDGPCTELAQELKDRSVPFLILTGQPSDPAHNQAAFSGAPRLEKPMSQQEVIDALRGLLRAELDGPAAF
jgi:DNA-binding response OmpR family regulator